MIEGSLPRLTDRVHLLCACKQGSAVAGPLLKMKLIRSWVTTGLQLQGRIVTSVPELLETLSKERTG